MIAKQLAEILLQHPDLPVVFKDAGFVIEVESSRVVPHQFRSLAGDITHQIVLLEGF